MHNFLLAVLFIISFIVPLSAETQSNDSTLSDTLNLIEREDRNYIARIIKEKVKGKDQLALVKTVEQGDVPKFYYEVLMNGVQKWDLLLTSPATDLEAIFVKSEHNKQIETKQESRDSTLRGSYRNTPWVSTPPLYKEEGLPRKLLDLFAWKSGGEINFYRHHMYNFNQPPEDTGEVFVDLGRPALYDNRMDMSYTHRYKFIWFGAGIERSWQNGRFFDTVSVDRGSWFSRMGWNVHVAFPGFRYEMFRDPGLIPFYGQYEDSVFLRLYPEANYVYLEELNIKSDTSYVITQNPYVPILNDTLVIPHKISPLGGLGHKFTVKIGYFHYTMILHPRAYKAPIQRLGMKDMPMFKGEWGIEMLLLPNGRVIPHLELDAYRTSIKAGPGRIGISPFHMQFEVWGRENFFLTVGFNVEYLMKEATFREE